MRRPPQVAILVIAALLAALSLVGPAIAQRISQPSAVTSLAGTANQVNVSASTGAVTLSLPQSIATTSTPTFGGLTLSGALAMGSNNITGLNLARAAAGDCVTPTYAFTAQTNSGLYNLNSDVGLCARGIIGLYVTSGPNAVARSDGGFAWSGTTTITDALDTRLTRAAAGVVGVTTGYAANGQTGVTTAYTIRDGGGAADCTITVTGGLITASTC